MPQATAAQLAQLRALLRIPQWNMEQWQQANAAVQALMPQGQCAAGEGEHIFKSQFCPV